MAEAVDVAAHDSDARVDLLTAVVAWIAGRKTPFGGDLRIAEANAPAAHRHILVLEDDLPVAAAPDGIERPQLLTGEAAFNAWIAERPEHDAVELAPAAECH